ncbi:MAG TPA: lipopolysaccharide heptosyltransferase II [Burkholderiales bacterium]|nr:lipopolysaccharide heptosyltransferase II [Burkholderiales bacterium]
MAKFLIIAPSWVGDTVLAQPLFMRLLQRNPGSVIDVFAPRWVAPVLTRMPEVNDVLDNPFGHGTLQFTDRWRVGRDLKQKAYDHAIVLPNSLKSAMIPIFAGIPKRTGFIGEARYGLLNDARKLDKAALPLMVERYALLAESPGASLQRPLEKPRLNVDLIRLGATLERLGLSASPPVVVFCPGAEYGPAKRWPSEHFATLAKTYVESGHQVWLLGSPKDKPVGAEINQLAGGVCRDLTGATGLADVIDLMSCAKYVVSNDSGLMHIAAALDRPLAALYGSSSPKHTPPLSDKARVISLELECSPCFQRECPLGHFNCMRQLQPGLVQDTLKSTAD